MCRLFAMHAGDHPVKATFWLLTAPDSLAEQSRREADGFGIGVYDREGRPSVVKAPIAAYEDKAFAAEARDVESITFIAHVRYASTGGDVKTNTHPFEQDNRLFAHNGVVEDLDLLDSRLQQMGVMDLVKGDTDSERVFALITAEVRSNGGDVGAAIASGGCGATAGAVEAEGVGLGTEPVGTVALGGSGGVGAASPVQLAMSKASTAAPMTTSPRAMPGRYRFAPSARSGSVSLWMAATRAGSSADPGRGPPAGDSGFTGQGSGRVDGSDTASLTARSSATRAST